MTVNETELLLDRYIHFLNVLLSDESCDCEYCANYWRNK